MARRQAIDLPYMRHGNPFPLGSKIGNVVISGAIHCNDEKLGGETPEDPEAQVAAMFTNIRNFMAAAGGSTDDIMKIRLLVRDPGYVKHINPEWVKMFPDEDTRPTRKIDFPTQLHGGAFAAELYAILES
jgi:2-iminobutanoate/2-iminopropanoate deaminase